jgi:hypothetical protein
MWLKIAYTAFIAVLVPVYWVNYGPSNFLYFCDLALLVTLAAIWLESPLLASMPAVGILAPQALWVADFFANMAGHPIVGMTDYMFDASLPLQLRALSLFHGWLPFLLLFLVWRLGYDHRAFRAWTVLALGVLFVCYVFMPPPSPNAGAAAVNINYVYGMSDKAAQTWMPGWAWLMLLMVALPTLLFAPVHLALKKWMSEPHDGRIWDRICCAC